MDLERETRASGDERSGFTCARMSSRRAGVSPVRRPPAIESIARDTSRPSTPPSIAPVRCPICDVDLSASALCEREAHADACASALSQRSPNAGNATASDDDPIVVYELRRGDAADANVASSSAPARLVDTRLGRFETVEAWLARIGMHARYFELYVREDLLDVEIARECTEEDLRSIGVSEEDSRVLARCGAVSAPPRRSRGRELPTNDVAVASRRPTRDALARAKLRAEASTERLWDVARGNAERGRGESLPAISRLLPKSNDAERSS